MRLLLLSVFVLAQAAGMARALEPAMAHAPTATIGHAAVVEAMSADCDGCGAAAAGSTMAMGACLDCQAPCAAPSLLPPAPALGVPLRVAAVGPPPPRRLPGQTSLEPPARPPSRL